MSILVKLASTSGKMPGHGVHSAVHRAQLASTLYDNLTKIKKRCLQNIKNSLNSIMKNKYIDYKRDKYLNLRISEQAQNDLKKIALNNRQSSHGVAVLLLEQKLTEITSNSNEAANS